MTELLEVFTAAGQPTGVMKPRADVHRDGDWHLASFVWIVAVSASGTPGPRVLFQRRAADKDVWPLRWDASCAGHVAAGESSVAAAIRELEEELGLHVGADAEALVPLAPHREEHLHPNGLVDREHHAVFVLRCDSPLEAYRPGPEVTALAFVDADSLRAFAERRTDALSAELWTPGSSQTETGALAEHELVPYAPAYLLEIVSAATLGTPWGHPNDPVGPPTTP